MNILDMVAVPTSAHAAHLPTPARTARAKRRALADVNANLPTRTPRRRPDSTAEKPTKRKNRTQHAIYTPLVANKSAEMKAGVELRNEAQTDGSSRNEVLSTDEMNGVSSTTEMDGKRIINLPKTTEFDSAIELPTRRARKTVVDREPILMINELLQLQKSVILNFGPSNTVGEERYLPFRIEYSSGAETCQIKFEHIPAGVGIDVTEEGRDGEPLNASFRIRQGESKLFYVTWSPVLAGQLHEEIRLKTNTGEHFCVVLLGVSKSSTSDDSRQFERAERQSSFVDRDHITYTAEQWEEIQCDTFSNWLNRLFQSRSPNEAIELSDHQKATEWSSAVSVFDSLDMRQVRSAIEREVTEGRLAITPRSNRNVLDEVYVREQLTKLLLSFTPRWLQLGLEILLGNTIFKGWQGVTKDSLKRVITQYILSDPDLVLQYTGGRVKTPSGRFEDKMKVRVHQHALSQIMILVFFLDRAKTQRVLTDDPNLFELESPLKSSDEILVSLCQDCFSKQSSIIRHLAYDGIGVSHVQRPLDEYDFYVKNLAVDLKDGVCLAKMIDLVTQRSNLLSWMRLPASSRPLRVHNVNFALSSLRQLGVKNISDITNAHVVDAHQPRILQLLWSSIMHFELPEFRQEIEVYKAARSIQMHARRFLAVKCYLKTCRAILLIQSSFRGYAARSSVSRMQFASVSIARVWRGYRAKIQYGFSLMAIITLQRVGRGFSTRVKVSKMTRNMNSAAVKIQRIWRGYSAVVGYGLTMLNIMTVQSLCRRRIALSQVARLIQARAETAAVAIQATWRGFCTRLKNKLIVSETIRVQRVCRGFLARRFVLRRVGHANKIQRVVRMWLGNKNIDELLGASPINARDRTVSTEATNLSNTSATITQTSLRQCLLHRILRPTNDMSGSEIERAGTPNVRSEDSGSVRDRSFENEVFSLNTPKLAAKSKREETCLEESHQTNRSVSNFARADILAVAEVTTDNLASGAERASASTESDSRSREVEVQRGSGDECYVDVVTHHASSSSSEQVSLLPLLADEPRPSKSNDELAFISGESTAEIGSIIRSESTPRSIELQSVSPRDVLEVTSADFDQERAIISIQSFWRRNAAVRSFVSAREAAIKCQRQRRKYRALIRGSCIETKSAILIQSIYRRHVSRSSYGRLRASAIALQSVTRCRQAKYEVASVKLRRHQAATTIQKIWRGRMAVEIYALSRMAVIMIQSAFRRHTGRYRYRAIKSCVILIQKKFRGTQARNTFDKQRSAAVLIQSIARSSIRSNYYLMTVRSAVLIQALARKQSAVLKFREYRRCVIVGQSFCRGCLTRRRISLRQEKSLVVQAVCRSFLVKLQCGRRLRAIATIQRAVRATLSKARARIEDHAAILIQRSWRGYSENINYVLLQVLVTKLQALSRGRKAAHEFKRQKHANAILQRAARVMINKQNDRVMHFAATEIQRTWRGYQANTSFLFCVMHSMMIQASVRGMMARKKYNSQRTSVLILQRAYRFYLNRKKVRAATELQRMWRGFSSRKTSHDAMLSSLMKRSISIGTSEGESAVIIQSHVRRIRATKLLHTRLASVIKIQRAVRGILERERTMTLEHDAAVAIQSSWRSFTCHADFMIFVLSAIRIQSFARRMLAKTELILLRRERIREQRAINKKSAMQPTGPAGCSKSPSTTKLNMSDAYPQPTSTNKLVTINNTTTVPHKGKRVLSNMAPQKASRDTRYPPQKMSGSPPTQTGIVAEGSSSLQIAPKVESPQSSSQHVRESPDASASSSLVEHVSAAARTTQGQRNRAVQTNHLLASRSSRQMQEPSRLRTSKCRLQDGFQPKRQASIGPQPHALVHQFTSTHTKDDTDDIGRSNTEPNLPSEVFSQSSRQRREPSRLRTSKCRLQDGFQPERQASIGPQPHATLHQFTSTHAKGDTDAIGHTEPNLPFEDSSDIVRSPQSASLLSGRSTPVRVEFDMSSKFAEHTLKAIRTLRRQKKLEEVRKATLNLDKITGQSVADCRLFIQASGQHYLFRILGICNRSSPHVEIVRSILSILKNLARQAAVVAGDSEVAVLTDVIQRFRDKSDIFALSSALLEGFLNSNPQLYSTYLTNENTRRLGGIIQQCRTTTSHLQDVLKGITCLENIISRIA